MSERITTEERETIRTPETVIQEISGHFERVGHSLTPDHLSWLIDDIQIADLSSDPLVERIGRVPLAKLEGAAVTFDNRFEQLSPEQQRYVLTHEYSHSLNRFFASRANTESYDQISSRVSTLPSTHISSYIDHLARELEPTEENRALLNEEMMAEVIAQYLTSDRTFAGFMLAKLIQFETNENAESELTQLHVGAEGVQNLAAYLDTVETENDREAFLDYHEGLRAQHEIWQALTALFSETDFDELTNEAQAEWLDQLSWDEEELEAGLHAEAVEQGSDPRTMSATPTPDAKPRPPFSDLLTFWRLYP
jgi:hypothetical protein